MTVCSWDGVNLTSPDGSHVVFAGRCPSTHPFNIPLLRSVYTFSLADIHGYDLQLSKMGDTTGDLMHADFVSGWPEALMPGWLGSCIFNVGCTADPAFPQNLGFGPSSLTFSKAVPFAATQGIQEVQTSMDM